MRHIRYVCRWRKGAFAGVRIARVEVIGGEAAIIGQCLQGSNPAEGEMTP
jgi:hypothetical protein